MASGGGEYYCTHRFMDERSGEQEEVEECPVCCNELDLTDKSIRYCECGCTCGYGVGVGVGVSRV